MKLEEGVSKMRVVVSCITSLMAGIDTYYGVYKDKEFELIWDIGNDYIRVKGDFTEEEKKIIEEVIKTDAFERTDDFRYIG